MVKKEYPEYVLCPNCKKEIKIQGKFISEGINWKSSYNASVNTEDLITMRLNVPICGAPFKMKDEYRYSQILVSACSHCKMILGVGLG